MHSPRCTSALTVQRASEFRREHLIRQSAQLQKKWINKWINKIMNSWSERKLIVLVFCISCSRRD